MMSYKPYILIAFVSIAWQINGQEHFSEEPLSAQFITTDYDNFWEIFDNTAVGSKSSYKEYWNNASDGLASTKLYKREELIILNPDLFLRI